MIKAGRQTRLAQNDAPFLTVKETAKYLRLCEKQVRRLIDKGELIAHRFGGAIRIAKNDLEEFIAKRRLHRVENEY